MNDQALVNANKHANNPDNANSTAADNGADLRTAGISRRKFLAATAAVAGAGVLGHVPRARAAQSIAVTCWGGSYEKGIREHFADPFTKETGTEVILVNNADLTKIKVQVESKNVQWDVFDSVGPQITAGSKMGLWEDIDRKIVNTSDLVAPGGKDYIGTYLFAGGIAWDPKRFPEGKRPMVFKDFWDAQRFPGRRGLRTRISETLEMALVADGVAPDKLYPLDIERGFKALDRIKPHVKKWIETTPETITLLTANEIDFSYTYLSRVLPAQKAGSSVQMSMQQTINSLEYLAVPKYSKNKEAAMRYLAFCLRPDRQAAFGSTNNFMPNAKKGAGLLPADSANSMPDMSNPNNIVLNDAWWADNYDALQKRYTEWMLI
jgi:putative spermidine/putrescine transport system substrate-binding protein